MGEYCPTCDTTLATGGLKSVCRTREDRRKCHLHQAYTEMMERTMTKTDQEFKADAGKPRPTLLEIGCTRALMAVQATLDYGERKYEAHSWQKVPGAQQRYDDAARRHRIARDMGENHDRESGLLHLSHEIICNLFLLELMIKGDPGQNWLAFHNPPQDHKSATFEAETHESGGKYEAR